ncbi:MAG: hypothetical protein GQ574_01715 [Crocinitomix sp.]|nr:hypothetical protein [Crocinitomix sp.]
MKLNYLLILATVTIFSLTSCVKDTCNGVLGNTFEAIDYDSVYLNGDNHVTLNASLLTLDDLPADYFTDVIAVDDNTIAITNAVIVTKTNLELTLADSIVPTVMEAVDLSYNFAFGDRRNYIDCQHAGSADSYNLELMFSLKQVEENQFEITNFSWNEIFAAGHL